MKQKGKSYLNLSFISVDFVSYEYDFICYIGKDWRDFVISQAIACCYQSSSSGFKYNYFNS